MAVDIIIVSFNTRDLLRSCVQSALDAGRSVPGITIFVVDNASHDGSPDMIRAEFPTVRLIALTENVGFGAGNNRGLAAGNAELALLLNSDAQLTDGALDALIAVLESQPKCVAAGPRLIYPDGSFQVSCRRFPNLFRNFWNLSGLQARCPKHPRCLQNWLTEEEHLSGARVDIVSGACFLARRAYLDSISGFDENLFLYEEEMDLFLPAKRRSLEVCYCGDAVVIHGKGSSVEINDLKDFSLFHACRSKYYCFRKHYGPLTAWLSYLSDRAILGLSEALARARGGQNQARAEAALYRRAYRESFVSRGKPYIINW